MFVELTALDPRGPNETRWVVQTEEIAELREAGNGLPGTVVRLHGRYETRRVLEDMTTLEALLQPVESAERPPMARNFAEAGGQNDEDDETPPPDDDAHLALTYPIEDGFD